MKAIFIVGPSRCGTTMLSRMLGRHEDIHTLPELHFFERLLSGRPDRPLSASRADYLWAELSRIAELGYYGAARNGHSAQCGNRVSAGVTAISLYRDFLADRVRRHGKRIPCEHTPNNLFHVDWLAAEFDARIIAMIRDPRDVALSQRHRWQRYQLAEGGFPLAEAVRTFANYHPVVAGSLWRQAATRIMATAALPRPGLVVKFENLVGHPEEELQRICDFIGVTMNPAMLEVERIGSSIQEDTREESGVDRATIGRWRRQLPVPEVALVEQSCGPLMEQFGYESSGQRIGVFSRMAWKLRLVAKAVLMIPSNLRLILRNPGMLLRRLGIIE